MCQMHGGEQAMKKSSTETKKVYLGFDVSQKSVEVYAVCGETTSKGSVSIKNDRNEIRNFLQKDFPDTAKVCVVMETGTHALWMNRFIESLGYEVLVAHARDIQLIYGGDKKNDTLDAEKLARLAQFDRKLLHPVKLMNEERQRDFAILKVRDLLVRQKTQIVNSIRGILRSFGESDEEFTVANMKSAGEKLNPELKEIFLPLLQQLNFLELNIKTYDRTIKKLCKKYKAREILRQIPGIGPEISLAFILIVGDPRRFPNAAHACAYFGHVPTQDQSGDVDKQLSITKHGNKLMRRLLVQGAQYIMGPFAEESDLRHFGMKIASRGGKTAKKKAKVAVARKLVTVLLALWANPEIKYDPIFQKNRKKSKAA